MSADLTPADVGVVLVVLLLVVVLLTGLGAAIARAADQRRAREEAGAEHDEFGPLPPRHDRGGEDEQRPGGWWQS